METTSTSTPVAAEAKPAKKAPKASTSKAAATSNGKASNGDLRLPQIRMLRALGKAKKPMTRAAIVAAVTQHGKATSSGFALGPTNPALVKPYLSQCGYLSLLGHKFVRQVTINVEGAAEHCFEITAAGRKALAKVKNA